MREKTKSHIINILLVSTFLFSLSVYSLNAQEDYPDIKSAIEGQFEKSINDLGKSIVKSDPYGLWFSVTISETTEGDTQAKMYENPEVFDNLNYMASLFVSKQNFYNFNFDIVPKEVKEPGRYIYAVGIFAELVTNNPAEYHIQSTSYTYKSNINGKFSQYIIEVSVAAIVKKPANGSIVSDVYFYDKDGAELLWDLSWGNIMPLISYIRVGPGNNSSNTKTGEDFTRTPDIGGRVAISDVFSPGYYLPVVKFRGCSQEFTNYDKFSDYESVLRLEKSKVQWKYIKVLSDGTVVPESTLKTESIKAGDLKTFYSKSNTIKGNILDSNGELVKTSVKVILKPEFTPAKFTDLRIDSKSDGTYEFKEIESGVYSVYVAGNQDNAKLVEVCNCPQKNETQNYTYEVNVINKPVLYNVIAEYNNPELLKIKYKWNNVSVGFPEDLSVLPAEQTGDMYDMKPPFTANLGPYGKFSFYSNIPEQDEEGFVVSKEILNTNFTECVIEEGSFAIKKVAVESPYIFTFLEFNVELQGEDPSEFLLFPVVVGCVNDNSPYAFKWNKLDEAIITKLNNGESAVKTLTNQKGASMTIKFEPQK